MKDQTPFQVRSRVIYNAAGKVRLFGVNDYAPFDKKNQCRFQNVSALKKNFLTKRAKMF